MEPIGKGCDRWLSFWSYFNFIHYSGTIRWIQPNDIMG